MVLDEALTELTPRLIGGGWSQKPQLCSSLRWDTWEIRYRELGSLWLRDRNGDSQLAMH